MGVGVLDVCAEVYQPHTLTYQSRHTENIQTKDLDLWGDSDNHCNSMLPFTLTWIDI